MADAAPGVEANPSPISGCAGKPRPARLSLSGEQGDLRMDSGRKAAAG